MTDQALHKLFSDMKSAPAETNIAEVSQWINTAAAVTSGASTFKTLNQNKIIIMSSIITVGLIGTVLFFTGHPTKNEKNILDPSIQKSIITNEIDSVETTTIINKKQQNSKQNNKQASKQTNKQTNNKNNKNKAVTNNQIRPDNRWFGPNVIQNNNENRPDKWD